MIKIYNRLTGKLILEKETLVDADLYRANLRGADLRGANLRHVHLYRADLCGADLRDADLYGADLSDADLYGVNLCGANLYGAELCDANLYNANLYGANLYGADLCGANLRNVKGILVFIGQEDQLIYYKYQNEYFIQVSCINEKLEYMLENFEQIGEDNNYSDKHIKLYGDIIKLFSKYDLRTEKAIKERG